MPTLSKYSAALSKVAGVAIAASMLATAPQSLAKQPRADDSNWSDWKPMNSGYLARRREPQNLTLPQEQRRSAKITVEGKSYKLANANKKLKVSAPSKGLTSSLASPTKSTAAASAGMIKALWLYTDAEGIFSVSVADVASEIGKSANTIRRKARKGRLTLKNDRAPVSWYFDEASDSLLFVAQTYSTFHSDINAYRFALGSKNARPMNVITGAQPATGVASPFLDTLTFEEEPDLQFVTSVVAAEPEADYWFWRAIWAGYPGSDSTEITLKIPNPASAGTAQLRVTLRGGTDLEAGMEHQVIAELNGQYVGEVMFDGFEEMVLTAPDIQLLLDPSGNNLLRLSNTSNGSHPIQYLDKVEIDYTRLPVAKDGQLWLHEVAQGTQMITGFGSDNIVVIDSPTGAASLRQDVAIEADSDGGWSVSFEALAGRDYLVAQRSTAAVATILPDFPSKLQSNKNMADYLIIAPRAFAGTAQALADYRSEQFAYVKLVWLDDIYDQFNAGREDPAAITAFMNRVQEKWNVKPSMVTVVGKGSLDHKDRMGYGDSFVPVRFVSTPWSLATSDDRLLDVDTNSNFAIGRLPITNDAEGIAYVNKLIAHEASDYGAERYEAVLVADNPDKAGEFHTNSNRLAEQLLDTGGFSQVTKLYHPNTVVRADLILSSTWETGYISYDGHGTSTQVGDGRENFINATDAGLLQNGAYPIFTALTCAAGNDSNPGTRSLAAALVLNPTGGAIASLAPTGLSLDQDAQILGTAFVDSLFSGMNSIGGATLDAKQQSSGRVEDFMPLIYSVVGEPAVFAR